jgi:hypothetical protein
LNFHFWHKRREMSGFALLLVPPAGSFSRAKSTVTPDGDKPRGRKIPAWIYLAVMSIGLAIAAFVNGYLAQPPV